jgi:hypothetical protein
MLKRFAFLLLGIFAWHMQSQEVVLSFKNEGLSRRISKDSYTLINNKTKDLALFIVERNDVIVYVFDSDFKELSTFKTTNVKSRYSEVLGYGIKGDVYSVLYTDDTRKEFVLHHFNLKSNTSSISETAIDFTEGEVFLDAITYNNGLYVLSGDYHQKLKIHRLNGDYKFESLKTFFLEDLNDSTSLIAGKVAVGSFIFAGTESSNVTKIDPRVPSSIERTSEANKIYQNEEKLYLTFDSNTEATILYTINLNNLSLDVKTFAYPKPRLKEVFKRFNSFVFQDNIFQIASSKHEMALEIKDFEGRVIKDFYVNRDMPITFKNTPIIQEGATALPFVTTRVLEQTSKYLRKISSGHLGINVQNVEDLYYMTLGGYEVTRNGSMGTIYSPMFDGAVVSFNPTYLSYGSYYRTKSTYFNTLLNSKFEHIKGKLEPNIFDQISDYKKDKTYITAEDVFYIDKQIYLGYFNLKDSTYHLVKF